MSVSFIWYTNPEHRNCPLCASMDGNVWTFNLLEEELPSVLTFNGVPVWDIASNHSVSHFSAQIDWECYCMIDVLTDFSQITEQIRELTASLIYENALPRVWT